MTLDWPDRHRTASVEDSSSTSVCCCFHPPPLRLRKKHIGYQLRQVSHTKHKQVWSLIITNNAFVNVCHHAQMWSCDPDCSSLAGVHISVDTFERKYARYICKLSTWGELEGGRCPSHDYQSVTDFALLLKGRELTAGFQGGTKAEDKEVQRDYFIWSFTELLNAKIIISQISSSKMLNPSSTRESAHLLFNYYCWC